MTNHDRIRRAPKGYTFDHCPGCGGNLLGMLAAGELTKPEFEKCAGIIADRP